MSPMNAPEQPQDRSSLLRALSDQFLMAVSDVHQREGVKRSVDPDDAEFLVLAVSVREAVERLLDLAKGQEALAHQVVGAPESAGIVPIDEIKPDASLAEILARWREVERQLATVDSESPEANRLLETFDRLRRAYAETLRRVDGR